MSKTLHTFTNSPSLQHRLIPLTEFLALHPEFSILIVGIALFLPPSLSPQSVPTLLLVQRAAHEELNPNVFELPGGGVEEGDETVLHAVQREMWEETGLVVSSVLGEFEEHIYNLAKREGEEKERMMLRLNFAVEVVETEGGLERPVVKLNPEEHQAYVWATEADLGRYNMTEAMRTVVANAFKWAGTVGNVDKLE